MSNNQVSNNNITNSEEAPDCQSQLNDGIKLIVAAFEQQSATLTEEIASLNLIIEDKNSKIAQVEELYSNLIKQKNNYESTIKSLQKTNDEMMEKIAALSEENKKLKKEKFDNLHYNIDMNNGNNIFSISKPIELNSKKLNLSNLNKNSIINDNGNEYQTSSNNIFKRSTDMPISHQKSETLDNNNNYFSNKVNPYNNNNNDIYSPKYFSKSVIRNNSHNKCRNRNKQNFFISEVDKNGSDNEIERTVQEDNSILNKINIRLNKSPTQIKKENIFESMANMNDHSNNNNNNNNTNYFIPNNTNNNNNNVHDISSITNQKKRNHYSNNSSYKEERGYRNHSYNTITEILNYNDQNNTNSKNINEKQNSIFRMNPVSNNTTDISINFNKSKEETGNNTNNFFKKSRVTLTHDDYLKMMEYVKLFNSKSISKQEAYNNISELLNKGNYIELLNEFNSFFN